MTTQLREGLDQSKPEVNLSGAVECDEVYVTAGHKGNPEEVKKKGAREDVIASRGFGGGGTLEKEKPPIFGMIQRGGEVVIRMMENVQQRTIEPLIKATIALGTMVYTDEYAIYNPLQDRGYAHKTVCHGVGEYARDEDGDSFCEVHVNTMEGFWSLLRSWLRPHRGISQEKLPLYLSFFEFVHNAKSRGKALLSTLLHSILSLPPRITY
jgi:transposase-like protein